MTKTLEDVRLRQVRDFLKKIKAKMKQIGGEFMYDKDEMVVITHKNIDVDGYKIIIKTGDGTTLSISHCIGPNYGPYEESQKVFDEWFGEFKNQFFTIQPLTV